MNVDVGTKRQVVYTENNVWEETTPFKVENFKDCSSQDLIYIIKKIKNVKDDNVSLKNTTRMAITEAIALFALMMAFLISFVF